MSEPWLVDLLLALDRQLHHIERNLSHYFSPNTHLVGEGLALYVAGQVLPLLRESPSRTDVGRKVLMKEMDRQIAPDGGHYERSTHYHRYMLDFYLLALAIARIANDPAAAQFEKAVGGLASALRLISDDNGRFPHIGDEDSGTLLRFPEHDPDDASDSLAAAAALLDRPDLVTSPPREEVLWLLAHPMFACDLERSYRVEPTTARSGELPETGYCVARSEAGEHLVIDGGTHGYGGHTHADALALTLSLDGIPLLIDPGSACYTTDPVLRDRFRSTSAHNTVVIDDRQQSTPDGPFRWAQTADATRHCWHTGATFDYFEASHNAYRPLEHRRHVLLVHGDVLMVADLIDGEGIHRADLFWHFDPRWAITEVDSRSILASHDRSVKLIVSSGNIEIIDRGRTERARLVTRQRTAGWNRRRPSECATARPCPHGSSACSGSTRRIKSEAWTSCRSSRIRVPSSTRWASGSHGAHRLITW